jgi:hypothetical protein
VSWFVAPTNDQPTADRQRALSYDAPAQFFVAEQVSAPSICERICSAKRAASSAQDGEQGEPIKDFANIGDGLSGAKPIRASEKTARQINETAQLIQEQSQDGLSERESHQ